MDRNDKLELIMQMLRDQENSTVNRITMRYGEALMRRQVCEILNCGPNKVYALIEDGVLQPCCGGSRISAASVAAYIDGDPKEVDHQRRMQKRYPGMVCV